MGTQVGGIPEIMEDGKSRLLVEHDDSAALAHAMVTKAEFRRVLEHFDLRVWGNDTCSCFRPC
jgi:glycosyltransferase involved in cell wall biosynthesis